MTFLYLFYYWSTMGHVACKNLSRTFIFMDLAVRVWYPRERTGEIMILHNFYG